MEACAATARIQQYGKPKRRLPHNVTGANGYKMAPGRKPVSSGKLTRAKRLQVHLHADDIAAIDEFRFKARIPSRAAAVREILRRGLAEDEKER